MAKLGKQKLVISSVTEVDVKDAVTEEVEKAVKTIVEECSKKYMRNIDVALIVNVK